MVFRQDLPAGLSPFLVCLPDFIPFCAPCHHAKTYLCNMYFADLRLTGFRNYERLALSFSAEINCFTGNNGEGKTNILEAIQYLCTTRGWISKQEKFALREGDPYFSVEGKVENGEGSFGVQCNYMPPKGKRVLIDKRPLDRMSEHVGRIPIVTVLPNDTQLIHGSPSHRRRFMDTLISQYAPEYLAALIQYENALDQRNALLAMMAERRAWDPEQLDLWDQQLTRHGRQIHVHRRAFLEEFEPAFQGYFQLIVSEKERPDLNLATQVADNTDAGWRTILLDGRMQDRFSQRSSVGVHKDDLEFSIGGQSVRNYGSQGQQKTFIIALKLAQYEVLERRSKKPPVLLLDDIFDKLDEHRLKAIASILDTRIQGQVFITDTSLPRMTQVFQALNHRKVQHFQVENASVAPILAQE